MSIVVAVTDTLRAAVHQAFAEAVHALGHTPALITSADGVPADTSAFGAVATLADPYDPKAVADRVRALAGADLAGLTTNDDRVMTSVAYAAELLGVARGPADGIARARNKYAMRKRLRAAGLPSPDFALISDPDDPPPLPGPAVLKPVNGMGSALIRRVATPAELSAAYREVASAAPTAAEGLFRKPVHDPDGEPLDATRQFLVDGLLTGPEYDAEIVVRDGTVHVTLLVQVLADPVTRFGIGYAHPTDLSDAGRADVERAVAGAVTALGIDNALANATVIVDETRGPTIVEINAGRSGGQLIGLLTGWLTGVDVRRQHVALAVGAEPDLAAGVAPDPMATLTVFPKQPGRVKALSGLDKARRHPNVVELATHSSVGDRIDGNHAVYAVNALVIGCESVEELLVVHSELDALVRIEME